MDATQSIVSIGHAASMLQLPLSRLTEAAELLGISACTRINGIPYFDESDIERIADRIRDQHSNTAPNKR